MIVKGNEKQTFAFIGETSLIVKCVNYVINEGHEVVVVISRDPNVRLALAGKSEVAEDLASIEKFKRPSILFSIVNYQVLDDSALSWPTLATLNYHDGPLPRYAGIHCTPWAIINGEEQHGVSWHEVTPIIDGGRIVSSIAFPLFFNDTAYTANARAHELGFQTFIQIVNDVSHDNIQFQIQNNKNRTYFGRYQRIEEIVDWKWSAEKISALRRGTTFELAVDNWLGEPKIILGESVVFFEKASVSQISKGTAQEGQILEIASDAITVSVGDKAVEFGGLLDMQRMRLPVATVCNSQRLKVGTLLPRLPELYKWHNELLNNSSRKEAAYIGAIARLTAPDIDYPVQRSIGSCNFCSQDLIFPSKISIDKLVSAILKFVAKISQNQSESISLGWLYNLSTFNDFSILQSQLSSMVYPITLNCNELLKNGTENSVINDSICQQLKSSGVFPAGAHYRYCETAKTILHFPVVAWQTTPGAHSACQAVLSFLACTHGTRFGMEICTGKRSCRLHCLIDDENPEDSKKILESMSEYISNSLFNNDQDIDENILVSQKILWKQRPE